MNELIEQMGNLYYQMYPMAYHRVVTVIAAELIIGIIGLVMVIAGIVVCRKEEPWNGKWCIFCAIGAFGLLMSFGILEAAYDYSNFDYWVTTTAIQMITGCKP